MKEVVVYGSRTLPANSTIDDAESVARCFSCLNYILNHIESLCGEVAIVSGMARGADFLGASYAVMTGAVLYEHPADWKRLGQQAGFIRNIEMASRHNLICGIQFWDGKSTGTAHMRRNLDKRGIFVVDVSFSSEMFSHNAYKLTDLRFRKDSLPETLDNTE